MPFGNCPDASQEGETRKVKTEGQARKDKGSMNKVQEKSARYRRLVPTLFPFFCVYVAPRGAWQSWLSTPLPRPSTTAQDFQRLPQTRADARAQLGH